MSTIYGFDPDGPALVAIPDPVPGPQGPPGPPGPSGSGGSSLPVLTTLSRLACWLKADAGVFQDVAMTILATADGQLASAWADQSENGFNASQPVSAPPVYRLNQFNGLPAVQFSAASKHFLSLGNVLGKPPASTIFVVMSTTIPTQRQSPHGSVNNSGHSATSWGNSVISQSSCPVGSSSPDFGDNTNFSEVATAGSIWAPNIPNIMTIMHRDNEPALLVAKNGAVLTTTPLSIAASACVGPAFNFSIGREGDYDGIYLDGMIAEFLVYVDWLLPADRSSVENYLKTKYALTS